MLVSGSFVALVLLAGSSAPYVDVAAERLAFISCEQLKEGAALSSTRDDRLPNVLCIRGATTRSLETQVSNQITLAQQHPINARIDYVVISGPGGEIGSAMSMAEKLDDLHPTVVVGDICASSCAQFLFLAGNRKVVLKEGILAFHGGPLGEEQIRSITADEPSRRHLMREQSKFASFYDKRNISMRMLTHPPEDVSQRLAAGEVVMWQWPEDKLREFGVSNVVVEARTADRP